MNRPILTKTQFENQSFTHWLRKGIMYNSYAHYLKFAIAEYKAEEATTTPIVKRYTSGEVWMIAE